MENIYNAIQNVYNMDKTTWQEVLAELYNLVAKVENKFDLFENKFGVLLGEEVTIELKKMYDDGSLATLINDKLLKDIKTEFSEKLDTYLYVYPLEYFEGNTDQEKIENAITFLDGKSGVIQLGAKTYRLQNVVLPSDISLVGVGNTVIKPIDYSLNPMIRLHSNSSLKNLTIDDDNIQMMGIYFGYDGYGVTEMHKNIVVENVNFNIKHKKNYGIVVGYCENVKISHCSFENTNQTKSAILIHTDDSNITSNVIVSGCSINGFEKGIHSYGTGLRGYLNFNNNIIVGCGSGGIDMYHAAKSTVIGNTIYNCNIGIWGDTISLDNSKGQGTVISNNQIHDCSMYGMYCEELCGTSLNNNHIYRCGIGIYGGAGLKYTSFANNNISFCKQGMLISNEYVPGPMVSYFNQDCSLKGNTICYNENEGVILKGLKGIWVIDNNDIFNNNTSNTENVYGFAVGDDPSSTQTSQKIIFTNNRVHNEGRSVGSTNSGYQQGAYIKCTDTIIQNNYFNNAVEDFRSYYSRPILVTNIFTTTVALQGGANKVFGNIGYLEGDIVSSGNKGIRINASLASLPVPYGGDEGRIVKIARTEESDELYYICKRKANGTYAWQQIFI